MVELTMDQKQATANFMAFLTDQDERYFILDGTAGTGKSFLLQYLLSEYKKQYVTTALLMNQKVIDYTLHVTATTNKAAGVLNSILAHSGGATTIHKLMGVKVNQYKSKTKLSVANPSFLYDAILFIDESSFIDNQLFDIIEESIGDNVKVVFMGDKNQLTPVGLTSSVLDMKVKYRSTLKQVMRNRGSILVTAMNFRNAVDTQKFKPVKSEGNFNLIDGPKFQELVEKDYLQDLASGKAKIITWTNKKVIAYNQHIRKLLGYPEDYTVGETLINNTFLIENAHQYKHSIPVDVAVTIKTLGPRRMLYGVPCKSVCFIDNPAIYILPDSFLQVKEVLQKLAKDKNWVEYYQVKNTWADLRMPYACSVHKAQGSTYDTVFIDFNDICKNKNTTEVTRLLYVAISRAAYNAYGYGVLPKYYGGMA